MYINEKHKEIVESREYKYIGSYRTKEMTLDGKNKKGKYTYIRIKCSYCEYEYDIQLNDFKRKNRCSKCCNKYENSFAYYIQQTLCESLNKYWDWDKNKLNPYLIYKNSRNKIWIKCDKTNYHGSYEIICNEFIRGRRCPYCSRTHGRKVHPKDSFAQWGINNIDKSFLKKYRSDKNTLDPRKLCPYSHKKIWIKCQNTNCYESYLVECYNFTIGSRCPYCVLSKGEQKIRNWLIKNSINFISQKEFNKLVGLNGGNLSYDFYLPNYNLLIEYQGEQHEKYIKGFHNSKKDFEKQVEHDRRKREYAKSHNIYLLEIRYYDFENIDNILSDYFLNKGELL